MAEFRSHSFTLRRDRRSRSPLRGLRLPMRTGHPFHSRSPYGLAKAAAHWAVVNYREAYALFAANGILFNHDSPLRPERFVTKKIVCAACRIRAGRQSAVKLGNLAIQRDWGWAPEYVKAMWRILQQPKADDFVVATGSAYSLADSRPQPLASSKHFNNAQYGFQLRSETRRGFLGSAIA